MLIQTEYEKGPAENTRTYGDAANTVEDLRDVCTEQVTTEKLYRTFRDSGLDFGPRFRTVVNCTSVRIFRASPGSIRRPPKSGNPCQLAISILISCTQQCLMA